MRVGESGVVALGLTEEDAGCQDFGAGLRCPRAFGCRPANETGRLTPALVEIAPGDPFDIKGSFRATHGCRRRLYDSSGRWMCAVRRGGGASTSRQPCDAEQDARRRGSGVLGAVGWRKFDGRSGGPHKVQDHSVIAAARMPLSLHRPSSCPTVLRFLNGGSTMCSQVQLY